MDVAVSLVVTLLLVLLNGFFVASEFALVSVRKTRVDELAKRGGKRARLLKESLKSLDKFISSTQLGITVASLALGWVGEPFLAHLLEPLFTFLPANTAYITAHGVAVATAFMIITFLHIVLGELAPKTIALQKSEATSLFIIGPLSLFTYIFQPFIWVLNGAGSITLRLLGFNSQVSELHAIHSEEEVKMILAQSGKGGAIPQDEVEMVYNVFKMGDMPVKQIMVPRTDIVAFRSDQTLANIQSRMRKELHSRYPVYSGSIDSIIGFIHVKDVYQYLIDKKGRKKLSQLPITRTILTVPETKKADEVLLDMQREHTHVAVVTDEYGGTSGMVTLEDIIESLVGEIGDEFDKPLKEIQKQPDGTYLIDGRIPVDALKKRFHLGLKGQGYTTIGGLVFGLLGRAPKVGDTVEIGNLVLEIEKIDRKRIKILRIKKLK